MCNYEAIEAWFSKVYSQHKHFIDQLRVMIEL
jgi:hypothetical protein